ncbi:hypothetical protein HG541_10050 [Proteus terrae subsp. cibarius]|uniref:hypothetical protein n=1 Tax=Proteus TaxID=583 RepID=UPI001495619E|nr:hypothetical protein [Proteus terrae]QKD69701.1 hypothetical protein HG541_10050 [Proteus terrae subsp. cibarius]
MKNSLFISAFALIITFISSPSVAKENRKLSDVAEMVCVNHEDKASCEGFVNTSIILAFEQGRVSGICDSMTEYGEKIPDDQKDRCSESKQALQDVRNIKF